MHPLIIRYGGRKFLLILGGCGIFTLLFVAKYLDQAGYITLITLFAGGYLLANDARNRREHKHPEATE